MLNNIFKLTEEREWGILAEAPAPWVRPVRLGVVFRFGYEVYIEWPEGEPMEHVIHLIRQVELDSAGTECPAVFDPLDDDLLQVLVGGYRLHGMFVNDLT